MLDVATPLWPSVGVKPNTYKVGDLESSGTPECSEFDNKAKNTSHWGVLGVIEKVLKRRYRKWLRIGHLDTCSSSYEQKKGRESNWQFDSRPLKVGNRPLLDIPFESAIWRWKVHRAAENTIWGKVVASPESGPWWVLCVQVPVACPNTQGCPEC
jgi:hypothetical protein